jgi:hypothetical protein
MAKNSLDGFLLSLLEVNNTAMAILSARDKNGKIIDIPAITGETGKSAYKYAQEGGYEGTEEEFKIKLAREVPDVTQEIGDSESLVMSQRAVTNLVASIESNINTITDSVTGTVYELSVMNGKLILTER